MAIQPYNPRKTVYPYLPAVLDIETRSDGSLIAIGFAYETEANHYETFTTWSTWVERLQELLNGDYRSKISRIFAHNGGGFDWLSLFQNLSIPGEIKVFLSGSKMIGAKLILEDFKVQVKLMDSLALLPTSLKKLTNLFDIQHKKLDLSNADERLPEQVYNEDEPLFWQYLKNDVLGLQETIQAFWEYIYIEEGNIGELPMTLASLSMRLWRKGLEAPIYTTWNQHVKAFERRAYTGGRVELFEPGVHPHVMSHDINSLYPSVMRNNQYPLSYQGAWVPDYQGFGLYEVQYCQTNRAVPPLLRDEESKEFSYTGHGVYTSVELEYLRGIGGYFRVIMGYVYYQTGDLFTPYIDRWYSRRLEHQKQGNDGFSFVCKILMNSLYGKFGQHEHSWGLESVTSEKIEKWIENEEVYMDYGDFAALREDSSAEHIFVAVAAFVTAYARCRLFDYIMEVIYKDERILYVDTDSIHHTGALIATGTELGEMKLEFEGSGIYMARKLYHLLDEEGKAKVVAKGVGKKSHAKLTEHEFRMMDLGYDIPVEFVSFHTVRECLLHGKTACLPYDRVRTLRKTEKQSEYIYNPALIEYNKQRVKEKNNHNV